MDEEGITYHNKDIKKCISKEENKGDTIAGKVGAPRPGQTRVGYPVPHLHNQELKSHQKKKKK